MRKITGIVIHCSASKNGDARVTRDIIDRWHRDKGWNGIGYHYVVHVDGSLHEGRPLDVAGAHTEGNNANTIGICMVGTDAFTEPQWATLGAIVASLLMRYPEATVCGHRDYSPDLNGDGLITSREWIKICPGFDVARWRLSGMDPLWDPAHLIATP